ncbi:MAG TPA: cbb3-type cytochrome c oxidase subunit 3 [Rhodanobacteraceae bacterium]|nr:cbb3-type cytochrome c oxidase subunit 3 [Rhodanobacteraceae bacterium]
MNPIWGHVVGVITVILMSTFLGIWYWAWRKSHKPTFSRLAALPMEDELEGHTEHDGEQA